VPRSPSAREVSWGGVAVPSARSIQGRRVPEGRGGASRSAGGRLVVPSSGGVVGRGRGSDVCPDFDSPERVDGGVAGGAVPCEPDGRASGVSGLDSVGVRSDGLVTPPGGEPAWPGRGGAGVLARGESGVVRVGSGGVRRSVGSARGVSGLGSPLVDGAGVRVESGGSGVRRSVGAAVRALGESGAGVGLRGGAVVSRGGAGRSVGGLTRSRGDSGGRGESAGVRGLAGASGSATRAWGCSGLSGGAGFSGASGLPESRCSRIEMGSNHERFRLRTIVSGSATCGFGGM
jgi:hypothetical protein